MMVSMVDYFYVHSGAINIHFFHNMSALSLSFSPPPLQDPSRNHKVLRAFQAKLVPPVIPFMPLVTKDAYFLHIGNETFVGGLVNFEKMRLVASNVRGLSTFRSASLPPEARMLANKNPATQQYIRSG